MRIGYVSKFYPEKDGGAIYAERLCDKLPCEVVRIGDIESTKADYQVNLRSWRLKEKLSEIVEKENLDLIHIQYVLGGQYFGKYNLKLGLVRAMNQKVPVIVTFTEVHTDGSSIREKIMIWLQKKLANKAAASVSHTPKQAEFMKRYKAPSYNIYMGLIKREIKSKTGKNILFFGMLGFGKGVEYLIRAMDLIPDFNLVVAGVGVSDDYVELLKKTVKQNRHGNVKLDVRWVPESVKDKYYEESNIVVLPYVWAPYQSGVLHDALSYGKPSVVTKVGGIWEIIHSYGAGVVIPSRSPSAIAEGVKKALKNHAKYQDGIKRYQKEASWEEVGKKHVEVYNEILSPA
jgi:glycosyltransferase involved in cell wall biosynthesis